MSVAQTPERPQPLSLDRVNATCGVAMGRAAVTSLREKLPYRSVETPRGACGCSAGLEPRGRQPQVQGLGTSETPVGILSARFPAVISSSGSHVCNLLGFPEKL